MYMGISTQTNGDYKITDRSVCISGGGGVYSDVISDSALYIISTIHQQNQQYYYQNI